MFNLTSLDFLAQRYRRRSILVVEDDIFLKPLIKRAIWLVDPYLIVDWVTNFKEACQALESKHYSLVIADFLLPKGKTGISLWTYCVSNYPHIPFVLTSGLSKDSIEKLVHSRMTQLKTKGKAMPPLLAKPFYILECRDLVKDVLHVHSN